MNYSDIPVFPGWEIVKEIGQGSFGCVYEIKKTEAYGRTAHSAMKHIRIPTSVNEINGYRDEGYDDASITALFKNRMEDITEEFSLMSVLKGTSNIVSYEDHAVIAHDDGIGWDILIRMELLTPLPGYMGTVAMNVEQAAISVGMDICSALVRCEKNHIIHRDIKPSNIFVNKDGDFKLGDFGIAKTADHTTHGTKTGTFNYMAPEVYGNRPYGNNVDIYSLGMVLYWILNERRGPFMPLPPQVPKTSDQRIATERRMDGDPLPAPRYGSEGLKTIVLRACAYDPAKRYQSAEDMLRDLERLKRGGAIEELDEELTVRVGVKPAAVTTVSVNAYTNGDTAADLPDSTYYDMSGTHNQSMKGNNTSTESLELDRKQLEETVEKITRELHQQETKEKKGFSFFRFIWNSFKAVIMITFLAIIAVVGYAGYTAYEMLESGLLYSIDESMAISITGYRDDTYTTFVIPEKVAFFPVTSIAGSAFKGNTVVEEIIIPMSVNTIDRQAFEGCTSLKRIEIPYGVISIGARAFYECTALEEAVIADSVTLLDASAFYNCVNLKKVVLSESITKIQASTFFGCENLVYVNIPKNTTEILNSAFSRCTSLQTVVLPDTVKSLGTYAFSNCTSLETINIHDSMEKIYESVFSGCSNLKISYEGTETQWRKIYKTYSSEQRKKTITAKISYKQEM